MRGVRPLAWIVVLASVAAAWPSSAWAIPAFARKYGFNCRMCHVQFPRLNDFGDRFRDNGYHLMGEEATDKDVMDAGVPPVAFRTSIGYFNHDEDNPGSVENNDLSEFQIDGVDLFAGGVMNRYAGFFLAYLPRIEGGRGVAPQDASLEQGNVVLITRQQKWMGNLRVGRFEPAYVPISALRSYTRAPYEALEFGGVAGLPLAQTQTGIEAVARLNPGWRFAGGFVNGPDSLVSSDSPSTLYLRASKAWCGEGASSGYRVGAQGLTGKARADNGGPKQDWSGWGLDTSLIFGPVTVLAQYVRGTADAALNPFGALPAPGGGYVGGPDYKWNGWLVEVDGSVSQTAVAFVRYGAVDTPSEQSQDIGRWTIGARQYLADHMALGVEYSHQTIDRGAADGVSDFKANDFAVYFDMAF
jgi:hypothetical protein